MAKIAVLRTPTQEYPADLQTGFEEARSFPVARADRLSLSRDQLADLAGAEAAFPKVMVDARGLTSGMRLHVMEPARRVLAEWRQARTTFDRAIEPYMADINAAKRLAAQIEQERAQRDAKAQAAEDKLRQNSQYLSINTEHEKSQHRFRQMQAAHGNREANMFAYTPIYWLLMLSIGVAEWMINYDVFYTFLRVPAIAAGATIIMGVLLAFGAHGHGSLLKQWSHRFGDHRASIERVGDWRMLALSTLALTIVLLAAGGSRYEVVMRSTADLVEGNLAGVTIEANPLRDVFLSLLANVAAWLLGVFISYMGHDVDPDYMYATRQARRWQKRWLSLRSKTDDEKRTIEAQFEKRVEELRATSESKLSAVRPQHDLLVQIDQHAQAIVSTVAAAIATNARGYHAALAVKVLERGGQTKMFLGEREMTPHEFQAQRVDITADDIRPMVS